MQLYGSTRTFQRLIEYSTTGIGNLHLKAYKLSQEEDSTTTQDFHFFSNKYCHEKLLQKKSQSNLYGEDEYINITKLSYFYFSRI